MARLLCTGDLHLGAGADLGREPGERLAEQEAVLGQIVTLANELEATLVFAGDAWERRRPTPSELLAFRRPLEGMHGERGYGLARAGVVIAGNHDVEAFERPTGFDAIETGRHWHYVSRPAVLGVGEVQFACLPWAPAGRLVALEGGGNRGDLNEALSAGLVEIARGLFAGMDAKRPRVLVAHWSVAGATASSGIPVELFREPVLDVDELEAIGFDAIILGHIHRPQVLGSAGSTFYVGSPMPLNFGEVDHDHVVWMLDVEAGSAQVFQIPVESRRLVTLDLVAGPELDYRIEELAPGLEDAIVKVRIQATETEARRLELAALRSELELVARKVWAIQVEVERDDVVRDSSIDETTDDSEALEAWLAAEDDRSEAELEPILERHDSYADRLEAAQTGRGAGAFSPTHVRAANYRTFRDLDLELPAGLVSITGPNGAGKSSLVNLIDLALFGPESRSWSPYLTLGEERPLEVELTFELGGEVYRVRRGYSPAGSGKTTLDLERAPGEALPWEPLTRESQTATQELLTALLGFDRDTFRASSMLVQGDGAAFTEAKPAARKALLGSVLGLGRFDELLAIARSDRKLTEGERGRIDQRLQAADLELGARGGVETAKRDADAQLSAAIANRDDARRILEENALAARALEDLAATVATLEQAAAAAGARLEPLRAGTLDAELASRDLAILLDEVATLPTPAQRADLERRQAELAGEIETYRQAVMRRQDLERTAATKTAERDTIAARAADLRAKAQERERRIRELAVADVKTERCHVCQQVLGDEAREATRSSLRAEIVQLDDEAKALDEQAAGVPIPAVPELPPEPTSALAGEIEVKRKLAEAVQAELHAARLDERRRTLQARIDRKPDPEALQKAGQELQAAALELEKARSGLSPAELERLRSEALRASAQVELAGDLIGEKTAIVARATQTLERLDELERKTADDRAQRDELDRQLDVVSVLERAYGRNGIPAAIIQNAAIPAIELEATRILAELGTGYRVELRTERELASGETSDSLDVVIVTEAGERPYETFSGGERTRLNLALRIALARLLANRRGAESRLLAIDEPEFLDAAGTEALAGVLRGLATDFDRIYLISHVPDLRDAFDIAIEVTRPADHSEAIVC